MMDRFLSFIYVFYFVWIDRYRDHDRSIVSLNPEYASILTLHSATVVE
jgi:hypothetical protein